MKKVRKYRKLLSSLLIFTLILSMGSGVFAAKSAGAFAKKQISTKFTQFRNL